MNIPVHVSTEFLHQTHHSYTHRDQSINFLSQLLVIIYHLIFSFSISIFDFIYNTQDIYVYIQYISFHIVSPYISLKASSSMYSFPFWLLWACTGPCLHVMCTALVTYGCGVFSPAMQNVNAYDDPTRAPYSVPNTPMKTTFPVPFTVRRDSALVDQSLPLMVVARALITCGHMSHQITLDVFCQLVQVS